jgi:GxxExxY protein
MEPQNTPNTQMDTGEGGVDLLSNRVIGCALTVLNAPRTGFLGNVYEMCGASLALRSNASSWACEASPPLRVLRDLRFHFLLGRPDRAAGDRWDLLALTSWKGYAGNTRKMEPQNTPNTQKDTGEGGVDLLSNRIIGCALTVLHALGAGFLEKVYENALVHELRKSGLAVSPQHRMVVRHDGIVVGDYTVDLLVEHSVLVELKVAKAIDDIHRAQCLNYLKVTGLHLCLLLNFGKPRLEIKRIVLGCEASPPLRVLRDLRFHFLLGQTDRFLLGQTDRAAGDRGLTCWPSFILVARTASILVSRTASAKYSAIFASQLNLASDHHHLAARPISEPAREGAPRTGLDQLGTLCKPGLTSSPSPTCRRKPPCIRCLNQTQPPSVSPPNRLTTWMR